RLESRDSRELPKLGLKRGQRSGRRRHRCDEVPEHTSNMMESATEEERVVRGRETKDRAIGIRIPSEEFTADCTERSELVPCRVGDARKLTTDEQHARPPEQGPNVPVDL